MYISLHISIVNKIPEFPITRRASLSNSQRDQDLPIQGIHTLATIRRQPFVANGIGALRMIRLQCVVGVPWRILNASAHGVDRHRGERGGGGGGGGDSGDACSGDCFRCRYGGVCVARV